MRLCELVGPSGVGKSAIYDEMVKRGGFIANPQITLEQAQPIFDEGLPALCRPFCELVEWIFSNAKPQDRLTKRYSGTMRALAKWGLCHQPKHIDNPTWMVVDGGLLHRGHGIDRLEPRMPVGRYFELAPLPELVVLCTCDRDTLLARNRERGGDHDRSDDVERSLSCDALMRRILKERNANIIEIDTTKPIEANAEAILKAFDSTRSFSGDAAKGYDAKRQSQPKWGWEQDIIEEMLSDLPADSYVLDCPVGTGRFLSFYLERKFWVHAVDLNLDMLKQAQAKHNDPRIHFAQADICDLGLWDNAVDAAVVCRMTRWLSLDECQTMFREMQRVAKRRVIFTARIAHARPEYARPIKLFREAQLPGWRLSRIEEMPGDRDYCVIMFEHQPQELSDEERQRW